MSKAFRITPVYDRLLRGSVDMPIGLCQLHITTAEQLCRLFYSPKSIKWVKKKLKILADNGYVQADCVPTKLFKSPYYYALASKGVQYLAEAGVDTLDSFRASKEVDKHALFVEHTLELNDLLIAAARLHQAEPRYSLHSFIHERILKRSPYKAGVVTIIPDAFLDFRVWLASGKQLRMPILLEHDRGTEEQFFFRRRVRSYVTLLQSGTYKQLFSANAITIAFTTFIGPRRLEQMRQWTLAELQASNVARALAETFLFACFKPPLEPHHIFTEPCWYQPTNNQPIALLEGTDNG